MRKNKIIYPDPLILHSAINSRFGDFVDRIYPIGLLMKYSTYLTRYASRIELHLDTESQDQIERNFTMLSSFITYQRVSIKSIYQLFLHSYSFFWLWNYLTFVTYKTLIYICSEFNSFSNKYLRRQITKVVLLERSNVTCKVIKTRDI